MYGRIDKDYRLELNKGRRIDCLDRLDQVNMQHKMKTNFVKWWNVAVSDTVETLSNSETMDPAAVLSDEQKEIYDRLQAAADDREALRQAEIDALRAAADAANGEEM